MEKLQHPRRSCRHVAIGAAAAWCPVEEGQKLPARHQVLGKIAQPSHLKAELKIAETQIRDVAPNQLAVIDTRLAGGGSTGLVNGHVSRIEQYA